MNTATTAQIIADQIGKAAFAMLGAHSLASGTDSLSFRIRGSKKAHAIVVTLDASDTYTVEFFKRAPFPECVRKVATVDGVYVDSLHQVIESETGLYTRL